MVNRFFGLRGIMPVEYGGMGFGATFISLTFLGCIVVIVLYMTLKELIDEDDQALLD